MEGELTILPGMYFKKSNPERVDVYKIVSKIDEDEEGKSVYSCRCLSYDVRNSKFWWGSGPRQSEYTLGGVPMILDQKEIDAIERKIQELEDAEKDRHKQFKEDRVKAETQWRTALAL